MTFGEWLRAQIGKRDEMSVRKFARAVGVSHVTVGKWIAGTDYPRRTRLPKIAAALGINENAVLDAWSESSEDGGAILAIIAREMPESMTPDDARLAGHLLGALIRALQEWNRAEEERDVALLGDGIGSADEAAPGAGKVRPV